MSNAPTPKRVLVMYATRHGQTRAIARYVGAAMRSRGFEVDVADVADPPPPALTEYSAAVLAGAVHFGSHARKLVAFARRHREALERMPSALLSVSLTQGVLDSAGVSDERRTQASENLRTMLAGFVRRGGWQPLQVWSVAGAMAYTRYNVFVRWMMKRIARAQDLSTDTSQDHVYTNWTALERVIETFAVSLGGASFAPPPTLSPAAT